ncbi:MAG TPA: zinc ribbon domain-containing protein, partial [Dongiaceae bacterium]|nr:zinc ribbon domain-containing protein [Dongiaceae bacterium]
MTLTLSDPWRRGLAFGLLLIVALLAPALAAPATADAVCPYCKAPIEPGAAFCSNCGKKLETAATPAAMPATASSVVQVVSAVDTELTS